MSSELGRQLCAARDMFEEDDDVFERLLTHCVALHDADLDTDDFQTAALRICGVVDELKGARS